MNAKEIAEVREELGRGWIIEGLDPAFLPRLLAEREALLEALRKAAGVIHGEFCGGENKHSAVCKETDAAIAMAEGS